MVTNRRPRMVLAALALLVAGSVGGCAPRVAESVPPDTTDSSDGIRTVELPATSCNQVQRVGDHLYSIVPAGSGAGSEVIRYSLSDDSEETVVSSEGGEEVGWFSVNEKWIVWAVDKKLYGRSMQSRETTVLSESRDLYAPVLNGDLVAWDDRNEQGAHEIAMVDLSSGERTVIAPLELPELYNNFVAWDDDRLCFTDVQKGAGVYAIYNATMGTLDRYELNEGSHRIPGYAQPAGERIYSINFQQSDEWDWTAQRFGYFLPSKRRFVPVEVPGGVNSMRAGNGMVAVVDGAQRLVVFPADAPNPAAALSRPVSGTVDAVHRSHDGTLIAWRDGQGANGGCAIHIIEARR